MLRRHFWHQHSTGHFHAIYFACIERVFWKVPEVNVHGLVLNVLIHFESFESAEDVSGLRGTLIGYRVGRFSNS